MTASSFFSPSCRSRISFGILVISAFLTVFLFACAAGLYTGLTSRPDFPWLTFSVVLAAVLFFWIVVWRGYYGIRIEGDRIRLRGLYRQSEFDRKDVTGYTYHYARSKNSKIELLFIGLNNGKYFIVNPAYYKNYDELRRELTQGVPFDESLKLKAVRHEKWMEFITYACIGALACLMFWTYMQSPQFRAEEHVESWMTGVVFLFVAAYVALKYRNYAKLPRN